MQTDNITESLHSKKKKASNSQSRPATHWQFLAQYEEINKSKAFSKDWAAQVINQHWVEKKEQPLLLVFITTNKYRSILSQSQGFLGFNDN